MVHSTVLLVLLSALLHAIWNALIKREEDTERTAAAVLLVAALVSGLLALLAEGPAFPTHAAWGWGLAAGLFEGAYFITLALALARAPLGVAYGLSRGGAIVVVWPISAAVFAEPVTVWAMGGVALLLVGLFLVGRRPQDAISSTGVRWALVCAFCIAGYHLCYKQALALSAQPQGLFALALAVAVPLNFARLGRRAWPQVFALFSARPAPVLFAGTVCALSFVLFLYALALGGAGVVLSLRNTSVVFAQIIGFALGERPQRMQLAGIALIVAGALCLSH